jgi:cystathionine gamma-lyase
VSPATEFVLADPKGSVLCDYIATGHHGAAGSWAVEGIGEDFIPAIADLRNVRTGYSNAVGAIAGPFDSFLALRGVKTLALRMERHNQSALALAQWLEAHPKVARVHCPGLASHPQHALAKRQMRGGGGMISIALKSDLAGARRFLEHVHLFALAERLGGVESLIEHPAIMTHASIPAAQRAALGIGDTLIRLSVGIEALDDRKADLEAGFAQV